MKQINSCKLECDICALPVPEEEGFYLDEAMPYRDTNKCLQVVPVVVCRSCQQEHEINELKKRW